MCARIMFNRLLVKVVEEPALWKAARTQLPVDSVALLEFIRCQVAGLNRAFTRSPVLSLHIQVTVP